VLAALVTPAEAAGREGVCSYAVGGSVRSCSSSSVEIAGSTADERRVVEVEVVEVRREREDELRRACFSAGKGVVEWRRVEVDVRR